MAKRDFNVSIDLNKNELLNAKIQNLATPPTLSVNDVGFQYFNTTDKRAYIWDGVDWKDSFYIHPNHDGDVSSTGDGLTVINTGKVLNSMLEPIDENIIKGRVSAGKSSPENLTPSQVRNMLHGTAFTVEGAAGTGKVTIDRDLHVTGNITATKEVTAWVAGAVSSDVLSTLTATAPLRKSSASNMVIDLDATQFIVTDNALHIKDSILVPASHTQDISTINGLQTALDNKLDDTQKGTANGLAELDELGFVKNTQLPSYVDDVLEYANFAALPLTGNTGKIYITLEDVKTWRWSGTVYAEISASLALGETSATAYRGDRGLLAYEHSQTAHQPVITGLTANYLPKWSAAGLVNSLISDDGTNVRIGATGIRSKLTIRGNYATDTIPCINLALQADYATGSAIHGVGFYVNDSAFIGSGIFSPPGALAFYTSTDWASVNAIERVRIQSNGNVGIGTDVPNSRLHLHSANNTLLSLTDDNVSYNWGGGIRGYGEANNGGNLSLGTINASVYTPTINIKYNGNVGIGTDAPKAKLHSSGDMIIQPWDGSFYYGAWDDAGIQKALVAGYATRLQGGNVYKSQYVNQGDTIAWRPFMTFANADGNATFGGSVTATQLISNVAQGTAPLTVASSTMVANLNADLLDGQHGSYYQIADDTILRNRGMATDLNANDATVKGYYTVFGNSATLNYPVNGGFGTLLNFGENYPVQMYSAAYGDVYYLRTASGGVFGNWSKIWHDGNSNLSTVDWAAKDITASGSVTATGNINLNSYVNIRTIWGGSNGGAIQILSDPSTVSRWARIGIVDSTGGWVGGMTIDNNRNATFDGTVAAFEGNSTQWNAATHKLTALIGDGAALAYTVNHTFGTDTIAQCQYVSNNSVMEAEVIKGNNFVTFNFNVAPALNSIKITIIG